MSESSSEILTAIDSVSLSGPATDWSSFSPTELIHEEQVGRADQTRLVLVSGVSDPGLTDLVGTSLDITLTPTDGDAWTLNLAIETAHHRPTSDAGIYRTELGLCPPLVAAARRQDNLRLFHDTSLADIIRTVLADHDLSENTDYEIHASGTLMTRSLRQVLQCAENDWAFLTRLCAHWGVSLFWDKRSSPNILVFSDTTDSWPTNSMDTVAWRADGSRYGVYHLRQRWTTAPSAARLRDYQYRSGASVAVGSASASPDHPWGEQLEDFPGGLAADDAQDALECLASVRLDGAVGDAMRYTATSGRGPVMAGSVMTVADHPDLGDVDMLVVGTRLEWQATPAGGGVEDYADLTITVDARDKSADYAPPRRPRPRIASLWHGTIASTTDGDDDAGSDDVDQPVLDAEGRYGVRILGHEDIGRPIFAAVRMAQPHAGADYGMHFPLFPGTQVVLGFTDGDPDRPVILGALPDRAHSSLVTSDNSQQDVLATYGDVSLVIDNDIASDGGTQVRWTAQGYDGGESDSPLSYLRLGAEDSDQSAESTLSDAVTTTMATATQSKDDFDIAGMAVVSDGTLTRQADGDRADGVGGDRWTRVGGDWEQRVGGDVQESVTGALNETIGGALSLTVAGADGMTLAVSNGDWSTVVAGDWDVAVSGDSTLTVAGDRTITIAGENQVYEYASEENVTAETSFSGTISLSFSLEVSAYLKIKISADITIGLYLALTLKMIDFGWTRIAYANEITSIDTLGAGIKAVATQTAIAAAAVVGGAVAVTVPVLAVVAAAILVKE